MKNLLKLGMALLIAAMLIGFVGCFEDNGEEVEEVDVDYKNYTGNNRAIAFANSLEENVVIFASTLDEKNKLGGVKAGVSESGLSKSNSSTWFGKTQAFPVVIITEKQYQKNKGKLSKIEVPITKLYVFYNAQGENKNIYSVDGRLGGNTYYLELTMPVGSTWNVEMRDGGTSGSAIGYGQSGILHTKLFVQPEKQFNLYPVFHRWNPFTEVVDIVFPKTTPSSGTPRAVQFFFALSQETPNFRFNLRELLEDLQSAKPNLGTAYLEITNAVTNSMIHMTLGGQPIRNALGISAFGPGLKSFKIPMAETGGANSGNFADSAVFEGYAIGMDGDEVDVIANRDEGVEEDIIQLQNGYIYQISVTGNFMDPPGIKPVLNLKTTGLGIPKAFDWEKAVQ